MLKKAISKVFVIIVSIAFLQIAGTILLARNLSKEEMGFYRLILTIIDLGALTCLLGCDHAFVRFFSSPGISFGQYDWKNFLKKLSFISIGLIILGVVIIGKIYHFHPLVLLGIALALFMSAAILMFTACVRAAQKYELAITLSRLHFIIFFIFLLALYFSQRFTLFNILISFLVSIACSAVFIIQKEFTKIPSGKAQIPVTVIKNGFYYFGLSLAVIFLMQANYLFIGKMLSYRDVAIYAVIASIMRIFEFINDAAYHVLAPKLNLKADISIRRIFVRLFGVGLITAIFYTLFGSSLIHLLFKGQYDSGCYLLPIFIAIGVVRILYTIPASIVGGRSCETTLRNQFYVALAVVVINIILSYFFIKFWQLTGAALASLATWTLLLVATFIGTKRYIIQDEADFAVAAAQ